MKRGITILAAAVMLAWGGMAQTVEETTTMVGKVKVQAYTMSIAKDASMVQDALVQRMKDAKLKVKSAEGYQAALEQKIGEIATAPVSLYTKVEEQGKRKERVAVVTVCAIATDLTADQSAVHNNVRRWLAEFPTYLAKYEANLNLQEQMGNLKKAEKAMASVSSTVVSLEKSIAADQRKIASKQEEIKKLQEKIKDCEAEIKSLQTSVEKNTAKKAEAEGKATKAAEGVKAVQTEVDYYRQLAQ